MATPNPPLSRADRVGDALADVRTLLAWIRSPNPSIAGNALRAVDEQMLMLAEDAMMRVDDLLAESAADENTRILAAVDKALAAVRFTARNETDADAFREIEVSIEAARDAAESDL